MKSIGIIAEYNPFHNGHLYHIKKIKEKYKDYTIVLVMTGNFTERGDVSIIDKWKRKDIALNYGIDLVIELPFPFSTQSADFFAYGGITLLEKLKVEKIIFGSESNSIEDLELIAKTQIENNLFDNLVSLYSKSGYNYPTALSKALEDLTNKRIDTPNDLLGISYIKAILKNNYNIKYETIQRTNNYHEKESIEEIASATTIRNNLKNNIEIKNQVPELTYKSLNKLHFIEDYFNLIKYKIITEKDLSIYQTVDEGIDKLLKKEIINCNNYEDLINKVKSKRYTYNKISRMLLHILCNFTKEKANTYKEIKYIRILGFNTKGKNYLNKIKKDIDIPIISKINREKDDMLNYELETTLIYDLPYNENLIKYEFRNILYVGDANDKE